MDVCVCVYARACVREGENEKQIGKGVCVGLSRACVHVRSQARHLVYL